NLGAVDLAAIAIGRSLYMPGYLMLLGILLAINPITAQFYGAQKTPEIRRAVQSGLWLSQALALSGMIAIRYVDGLMHVMDIPEPIIPITREYLKAISWSLPATLAYLVLRFFSDGLSRTRPHFYFAAIAVPVNIAGNYILMYGKLGFPRMGAVGAGWATALVWWIMFLGMVIYIARKRAYRPYGVFRNLGRPQWEYVREILRVGVPNGISFGMETGMFAVVGLLIGSLGVEQVAGHQIALNVASITFMVPLGISIAATSRVGREIGRQDPARARLAGFVGIALAAGFMLLTGILMFSFPEAIARIYTSDSAVIRVAAPLLVMAALFQLSDGLQVSAAGALRGLKDTRVPMLVNAVAYWIVGLPVGYYLGIVQGQGARGLWIGLIAGLSVAAVSHTWRFKILITRWIARTSMPPKVRSVLERQRET
ncbi:MAG: MATE family efflux transporter, partial [Calditrichaeota bacterium]